MQRVQRDRSEIPGLLGTVQPLQGLHINQLSLRKLTTPREPANEDLSINANGSINAYTTLETIGDPNYLSMPFQVNILQGLMLLI